MIIRDDPPLHLSYCLNIHAGESWDEQFDAIRQYATRVRDRLDARPFGLGLRIGRDSVDALMDPEARATFKQFLADEGLYAFTINGFPYGQFHGTRVKEQVYAPDWRSEERRDYTIQLADILADLLAPGTVGSISTVPGSFKPWIKTEEDIHQMVRMMLDTVIHLHEWYRSRGVYIHLGLEPEPCCWLETTEEFIHFFNNQLLGYGRHYLQEKLGCDPDTAGQIIRRHLGINFDCCHLAIQYEDLAASLQRFIDEGILLSKIHLSAALICRGQENVDALRPFAEPVYFHQVKGRTEAGKILSWDDLPDALADEAGLKEVEELRCHFHVPLFWSGSETLGTTRESLNDAFWEKLKSCGCSHLEIETYTFAVMPAELQKADVVDSIVPEFEWVLERLK